MRLELTGRHVDITPDLRKLVEKRLAKLDRLLKGGIVSAQAVLTREKYRHMAEFTVHARGDHFLHGVGQRQRLGDVGQRRGREDRAAAGKVKGKWQERKRRATLAARPGRREPKRRPRCRPSRRRSRASAGCRATR